MSPSTDSPVIEVSDLVRRFGDRAVINDISFNVHRGETLVIMGGSGCGKSTLLRHIIGSMKPTSGSVKIFGEEITTMDEREIASVRRRFGMLFQSGALLASLTVGDNVALPLLQQPQSGSATVHQWRSRWPDSIKSFPGRTCTPSTRETATVCRRAPPISS